MGLNFNEFDGFIKNFKKASIEFDKFIFEFLTKNAMEVLAKTKKRTPIDTGELRRNWEITRVIKINGELVVYLYNNKDYCSYIEMGHTTPNRDGWIEGYYMATISIDEIENKIPKRFQNEFNKFMTSLGVG